MFLRLFLYRLKSIFLQKDLTFWTLAFPLILVRAVEPFLLCGNDRICI